MFSFLDATVFIIIFRCQHFCFIIYLIIFGYHFFPFLVENITLVHVQYYSQYKVPPSSIQKKKVDAESGNVHSAILGVAIASLGLIRLRILTHIYIQEHIQVHEQEWTVFNKFLKTLNSAPCYVYLLLLLSTRRVFIKKN